MFLNELTPTLTRILGALVLLIVSSAANAQINLVFGVYTSDQPTAMVKAYRPILTALETRLTEELNEEVKIKLQVSSSYQKGIDAIVEGQVDFAMLGPASYIEASNRESGLEILALGSKDGSKTFNGVICVREDSDIDDISELQGKSFAFGNEKSTIGRYLSQAILVDAGITAQSLKSYEYLGRHDRVAHAVSQGTHDAGALKEGTYKKLNKKGLKLRSLLTIPLINRPWVASARLDTKLVKALRSSMLTLDASDAFKSMGRKQFVKGSDSDFATIRSAINNNALFFRANLPQLVIGED